MMRKYIILILFLLSYTYADADMNNFVTVRLKEMENTKTSVFYSKCKSKEGEQYTATLLFPVGNLKGLLIEKKGNTVINLATVMTGKNGLSIEETHAGGYTYDRVKNLANELANYNFKLISPLKANALANDKTNNVCINAP